jgi:dihydroflavonol-4-reductase
VRALVTGATGFVGAHVTRMLVEQGLDVSVLVRPASDLKTLSDLKIKPILGSLTDHPSLDRAVQGMDMLFHVAADYRFWVPDPHTMQEVNVGGTMRLMEAAVRARVGRIVYTSSAVTVACSVDKPGTEADFLPVDSCRSAYQRTKVLAEQAVWRFIREGAPITIVNPSTPIGSLDRRPTPTGRLILDFLNGRLPAYLDAMFNWIAVQDVARGHWLAAEKGRIGERYILGHENGSLGEFLQLLADVSRQRAPAFKIPYAVAYLAGAAGEMMGRLTGREPRASLDGVRMAGYPMRYDSSKAANELGLVPTPLKAAVQDAVQWYRQQGYVTRGGV